MTDRYFALTVLLDEDTREDDAKYIIDAIKMIRGVKAVEPHVSNLDVWAGETRARMRLAEELWDVLFPKKPTP